MSIPNFRSFFVLGVLSIAMPAAAQPDQAIGIVLVAKGLVEIRDSAGTLRSSSRRTEIFIGDTLRTSGDGLIQFRMGDGAQLALQDDSEFVFDAYAWDADPATPDTAVMRLTRGCFRTIGGTIGDAKHDDYRILTPQAVIQINGATHAACIVGDVLFTGVMDGGTRVSNSLGTLNLGNDVDRDYSQTLPGRAPESLLLQPAALR